MSKDLIYFALAGVAAFLFLKNVGNVTTGGYKMPDTGGTTPWIEPEEGP